MDQLQTEVLELIFKYLHFRQKLQCKLVCRSWANVLQSGSDIESITIPSKNDTTHWRVSETFIGKVQGEIESGKKCKRLVISNYYRNTLAELFPNLNFLCFLRNFTRPSTNVYDISSYPEEEIKYLQNWHVHLKTYIELGYNHSLLPFLNTGVFHKLTTLVLVCSGSIQSNRLDELCDTLKNVPNLSSLYLAHINLSMSGLEILHEKAPNLVSLVFQHVRFNFDEDMPKNITSTRVLKRLEFLHIRFDNSSSIDFKKYLALKYPNVESIACSVGLTQPDHGNLNIVWDSSLTGAICNLMTNSTSNLKSFKLETGIDITQIWDKIGAKAILLEDLKLSISRNKEMLDKIVYTYNLSKHLLSLSLTQVPQLKDFTLFNNLTNLKKLHLHSSTMSPIQLHEMINYLPDSLETLGLTFVELNLDSHVEWKDSNIKCLEWKECRLNSDFSEYISRCMPNLNTLIMDECDTRFAFKLPNHHLLFAHISMSDDSDDMSSNDGDDDDGSDQEFNFDKYYKFTVGNITRRYVDPEGFVPSMEIPFKDELLNKHDRFIYDIYEPTTMYSDDRLPHYHFQFASIHTLLLKNRLLMI